MTRAVIALSVAAYGLIAVALGRDYPWFAPLIAAVIGAGWAYLHAWRPRTPFHGLFFALAVVGACLAARGDRTLLALGILTLALVAWDLAAMRRILLRLPRRTENRWGRRYALQSGLVGILGFAVAVVGLLLRPRLGFPAALGLSMTIVVLLILALWQSARVASRAPRHRSDVDDPATKNDAGGR